ncbi:hypothetical protein ACLUXI_08695 [Bifidobacterium apri]|uniref:hypothetical protein n=1 Tax=Bifidobacterium apri TaxID=1769423 RepID=UPI00399462F0
MTAIEVAAGTTPTATAMSPQAMVMIATIATAMAAARMATMAATTRTTAGSAPTTVMGISHEQ